MKIEVEVDLSPKDLAEVFINWGNNEQAAFLNLIGKAFKKANFDAESQCHYISQEIDMDGMDFVYTVSNFLKVRKIPFSSPKLNQLINWYPTDGLY